MFDMGLKQPKKKHKAPPEDPMVTNVDNATDGEVGEDDVLDSNESMNITNDNHAGQVGNENVNEQMDMDNDENVESVDAFNSNDEPPDL